MTAQAGTTPSASAHPTAQPIREAHVHRFRAGRVTELRVAFDDRYAVDAVLG